MLKKFPGPVFITIFSFIIAVAGVMNDLLYGTHNRNADLVKQLLNPLNLNWVFSQNLTININGLNYINGIFEILLLLGAILYVSSKRKESRLIRFVFAAIFLSNIVSFMSSIVYLTMIKSAAPEGADTMAIRIAFYAAHVCWIFVSYKILKYFTANKELQKDAYDHDGTPLVYYTEATVWQRILHVIIDFFFTIMLFSPMVSMLIFAQRYGSAYERPFLPENSSVITALFAILLRVVYYLLCETALGVSPAKLLTETRIIDYDGNKPPVKNIFGRTFLRLIPFESLTFFGHSGLHDKWSRTLVVKEKRTGEQGAYYLFIVPGLAVFFFLFAEAKAEYGRYRERQHLIESREWYRKELEQKIKNVSTDDFLTLDPTGEYSYSTAYSHEYLKAEQLAANDITFSFLRVTRKYYDDPPEAEVEKLYADSKDSLFRITFSKAALLAASSQLPRTTDSLKDGFMPLIIKGRAYRIKAIDRYFMPNIQLGSSHGYGDDYFSLWLVNKGWPADITAIDILEGDVEIKTQLPIHMVAPANKSIEGSVSGNAVDFKLNITVMDTLNRKQMYRIDGNTGKDGLQTITRIK